MNKQRIRAVTDVDVYVGKKIRGLRNRQDITQVELAGQLGLSFQQVQKYENGGNRLSSARLLQIAEVLNCKVSDLLPPHAGSMRLSNLDRVAATRDGMKLIDNFAAIKNVNLRSAVVELAARLSAL